MPEEPDLTISHRNLLHWRMEGSIYFMTFRVLSGILTEPERQIIFDHILQGHDRFYVLFAQVIMPDHVHLLLSPKGTFQLSRIMKGIKGVSANLINRNRGSRGNVWQDESWDRIMRGAEGV